MRFPFHCWTVLAACLFALLAEAATFTAKLDRSTIPLGESAVLILHCDGALPKTTQSAQIVAGLGLGFIGEEQAISLINGKASTAVTFRYRITPDKLGDFTVPSFTVIVGKETLKSEPLNLRVVADLPAEPKPAVPIIESATEPPPAFLKLIAPTNAVYAGEVFPIEVQLFFQTAQNVQIPQPRTEGVRFLLMRPGSQQTRAQIGNSLYNIVSFRNAAVATKPGRLDLAFDTDLTVVVSQGIIFGELKPMKLTSPTQTITVLPLPKENVPSSFNGAVGSFEINIAASPTNLPAGDPILAKITIFGRGALDNVELPRQDAWRDFKLYPPNVRLEHVDSLAMNGIKTFEQVITASHAEMKALPVLEFSFFDPAAKVYRTVQSTPIPLRLTPAPAGAPASLITTPAGPVATALPMPKKPEVAHIKPRLGTLAALTPPLVTRPWFLAFQFLPLLAFLGAVVWRKQKEHLSKNTRLLRQREVDGLISDGLHELRKHAAASDSVAFFTMLARLLYERLGERLDLSAAAINESVIEERLNDRLSETTLTSLRELFRTADQARYAPVDSTHDLHQILGKATTILDELERVKKAG